MSEFIADLLYESAARRPEKIALVDERSELSYAALAQRVAYFAQAMIALGLRDKGRVAVFMDKSIDACAVVLAAMRAGGIAVPLNPKLKQQQLRHILLDCTAQLLFTTTARQAELSGGIEDLETRVVLCDQPGSLPEIVRGEAALHCSIDKDPAALLYTSGSTGQPKGVVISHRNLVAGCQAVNSYLGTTEDDVVLALLPISFDAGLSQLTTGLAAGARVVLHTPMLAPVVARLVARQGITMITAVPPLWSLLTQAQWDKVDTASVRLFANTGGHMNAGLLAQLRGIFPSARPFLMYGLTEAFRSTYLDPSEVDRRAGSIGKAIPGAEILVLNAEGEVCAPGEPGELVHRGALVTLGYWNAPAQTAERFRPLPSRLCSGLTPEYAVWSGDIVKQDAEGFLYFVGRRDEMIKSSGYRISPTEIESLIVAWPEVREVAVFGVPAGDLGDAIYAVVVAAGVGDEQERLKSSLEAQCRKALPSFMMPRLVWLPELPRSANGKIDRPQLRRVCIALHGGAEA
ncbi:acyl-CoA ligase (AMP-forming), exosortase A system-associated [Variovorax sp. J2P1-59]|uniref:acyl-CoA ligase (AMP-forming), exosortase A system-associated n=1 Tax=Variovorax flavidus TaxID=3053501 RepID=UPI0025758E49|nr:acyl-CoA ligase (AMP-forming), exosortase A system-associated [Variovorax sp. J2P1-59]MDM0077527.1 acyl-CoA ligase (AMP-forming), exosortase A system-associated [Variovorax sp. J2P1-59]